MGVEQGISASGQSALHLQVALALQALPDMAVAALGQLCSASHFQRTYWSHEHRDVSICTFVFSLGHFYLLNRLLSTPLT